MSAEDHTADEAHWLATETPADWIPTAHEQVYLREATPMAISISTDNLVTAGAIVATAVPGNWTVILTAGPHRGYDVKYSLYKEGGRIHLDFYSVRPGYQHLTTIIDEMKRKLNDSSRGGTGVSAR